jgi:sterol desaturase/sphingolipid hydroxylase (fatty acid hydroxylase superfamily)
LKPTPDRLPLAGCDFRERSEVGEFQAALAQINKAFRITWSVRLTWTAQRPGAGLHKASSPDYHAAMSQWQDLLSLGMFFAIGLLAHLAETRWPLRVYDKPKAWMIDTLGLVVSASVTIAFRKWLSSPIYSLPAVPGFGWISDTAQFVENTIPWPIVFLVSVVVLDFLLYIGHRMLHTTYLWHTHALHHSVEHLYWFGGNRSSPFHVVLQLLWGTLLGLVWPVYGGMTAFVAGLIVYTSIQHFNHANIRWRLGPLEWLFVVPRYHFVHHGADPTLNNSNFGFLLTVWDRMFGTYTNPDHVRKDFPLGLNYEVGMGRLFVGLPPKSSTAISQSSSNST